MSLRVSLPARLVLPAVFVAVVMATPVQAVEEKAAPKAVQKVLIENDKVLVYETIFPVGSEAKNVVRPYRIGRALTDGVIERIYADGKREVVEWKAGDVRELGPHAQYIPRNIGKTEFRIFVVQPKSP